MKYPIAIFLITTLIGCSMRDSKETVVDLHNFGARKLSAMEVGVWNTGVRTIKSAGNVLRCLGDGTNQMMEDTFGE